MIGGGKGPYFVAAASAADPATPLWQHETIADDPATWRLRTQRRWVQQGAKMLGLLTEVPGRTAEIAARILRVPGTAHQEARHAWANARDIRARSRAVVSILALITMDAQAPARLLGAATHTGGTAPAYIWSPGIRRRLFPADGTTSPGGGRCRPPPSVESGSP